ncbi:hypothetical protein F4824DRAFT_445705 [Ustulina deusta]|nr:hypothetical protein F4823DRAFT_607926 [Ustulina deusta]KAI3342306.1 hypothetical protein F4824DRAFT_445705 [Ustulina deusta]
MAISKWTVIGCTATSLTALAISTWLLPFHRSYHEQRASPTHRDSVAISVVTPQQHHGIRHHGIQENYSLLIPANRFKSNVSDEEILARFTKGFFSGFAFTPERWLLTTTRPRLTDIPAIKTALAIRSRNSLVVGPDIWDPSSISPKSTPSFGSLLFGNFLTLDSSLLTHAQRDQLPDDYIRHPKPSHAFVEFAWGGERISLVGSHRFEVSRHEVKQAAETEEFVKITFSSVACKPETGLGPSIFIQWFHVLYSRLLFSDGIKGVLTE